MKRIAINGFGRIGRNFLRAFFFDEMARKKLNLIAINLGPASKEAAAHLFKYDTLLGTYPGSVKLKDNMLVIDGHPIELFSESDPEKLPWAEKKIDWVVESSGRFTTRAGAQKHIQAGSGAVLISAPAHDEDITIIPGVNDASFNSAKHKIVSLGSCTSNAFIPMLKIINDIYHIEQGFMTTIHAYTNSQVILDLESKNLRLSRAAAENIIPTSTGASRVSTIVLPELLGKIHAIAVRIPLTKVSLIDFVFSCKKEVKADELNLAFEKASVSGLRGIVGVTKEPLVSSDFKGDERSVIIDCLLTQAQGTMGKIFGWYDNEWAYSVRLKEFLLATT